MKKNTLLLFLFSLISGGLFAQVISQKELTIINKQADSLINLYSKYAPFTVDNEKLSESYISGFKSLFTSGTSAILNDLDPNTKIGGQIRTIKVDDYLLYARANYPVGLNSVEIKKIIKGSPQVAGNKITLEVTVHKEVLGYYQDQKRYMRTDTSKFLFVYNTSLTSCKIDNISPNKSMDDFCTINNAEALNLFRDKQFGEAKRIYGKTLEKCPDNEEAKSRIKSCSKMQDSISNHKSIYLLAWLNPTITNISVTPVNEWLNASSSSEFTIGGGLGAEIDLYSKEKINIGCGIGLGYLKISSHLEMDKYGDTVNSLRDIDGDNYTLLLDMDKIQEDLSINYLNIPINVNLKYSFARNFYLKADVGIAISVMIGSKYTSTTVADYRGLYSQYNGIILYGNELATYGFGKYNINASNTSANTLNSTNFGVFGHIGIGYELSKTISAYVKAGYVYGLSNICKENGGSFHLSSGNSNIQSLTGLLKGHTTQISIEVGIAYKLF